MRTVCSTKTCGKRTAAATTEETTGIEFEETLAALLTDSLWLTGLTSKAEVALCITQEQGISSAVFAGVAPI